MLGVTVTGCAFLSIQAQDFIEDTEQLGVPQKRR